MPSNRRVPLPSSSGTTWISISSSRRLFRNCWIALAPPPIATSLSPAASFACARALSIPSGTKWNDVPPCFVTVSLAWWVRTKTGTWNGGSSPHQPSELGSCSHGPLPPLNIRRPITTAPCDFIASPKRSESALCSPPSMPCCARKLASANAHSWSRSPPSPSGCSRLGFGPATNPSSDVVISATTLPIWNLPKTLSQVRLSRKRELIGSIGKQRHDKPLVAAQQHSARHSRRSEALSHLVERRVEGIAAVTVERERQLEWTVVIEVRDCYADECETQPLDHRHRRRQQPSHRLQDRVGMRGRVGQGVRTSRTREVVEAQTEHNRAADPPRRAHPPRDAVDEPHDDRVDRGG